VSEDPSGQGGHSLAFSMIRQIMFHDELVDSEIAGPVAVRVRVLVHARERDQHPIVVR